MKELIINFITELDEEKVMYVVKKALKKNIPPKEILSWLREGLNNIGKMYEDEIYFLGDLIMAGIIYRQVIELEEIKPSLSSTEKAVSGTILIGTIQDDVHDIGKDIFIGMAVSEGFNVIDLGVDVKIDTFIEKIKEYNPDILGISCLLTGVYKNLFELINKLNERNLRDKVKVIVGGVNKELFNSVPDNLQGDAYVNDAESGLEFCRKWMDERANIE